MNLCRVKGGAGPTFEKKWGEELAKQSGKKQAEVWPANLEDIT
jgi:hypothetical protein